MPRGKREASGVWVMESGCIVGLHIVRRGMRKSSLGRGTRRGGGTSGSSSLGTEPYWNSSVR